MGNVTLNYKGSREGTCNMKVPCTAYGSAGKFSSLSHTKRRNFKPNSLHATPQAPVFQHLHVPSLGSSTSYHAQSLRYLEVPRISYS